MALKKWYQDYRIFAPVAVAIIGLVGSIIAIVVTSNNRNSQGEQTPEVRSAPSDVEASPQAESVTFTVIVMDDNTKARLRGVQVLVDEQGLSRETDSLGRCTLTVLPSLKKLRLTVSVEGYLPQNMELTIFKDMDPVRVYLQPSE